jgi:DNA-binding LacI/PurR family transcriptional regulator
VAYVLALAEPDQNWDFTHEQILTAFNKKLMQDGRHALAVGVKGRPAREVFAELKAGGAWGVVLDTSLPEYVAAARASRLPFVIVDADTPDPDVDVIIQNNFTGSRVAAAYLLARGHERVGWVGPLRGQAHYRERFAGARAALNDAGRDFAAKLIVEAPANEADPETVKRLAQLLRSRERPTALVCMWRQWALAAIGAAREAGLKIGKDVEVVAWATEREYREVLAADFLGAEIPATMVWRPDEMAGLALERLAKRAAQPTTPACRTGVRVRLVEPQKADDVLRKSARAAGQRA